MVVGKSIFLWWSLRTIIVIRWAYNGTLWGTLWEAILFFDLLDKGWRETLHGPWFNYTPRRRWTWYENIFSRLRAGRRATLTDDSNIWVLKLEIMSSWRWCQREERSDSESEKSCYWTSAGASTSSRATKGSSWRKLWLDFLCVILIFKKRNDSKRHDLIRYFSFHLKCPGCYLKSESVRRM